MTYGERANGGQHGVVFTQPEVITYMLDLVNYVDSTDLRNVTILEPSAGDGAFVVEILRRLYNSSLRFGFDFSAALENVSCYELEKDTANVLELRIQKLFSEWNLNENIRFSAVVNDYLDGNINNQDIIIGNPPYVRHEQIPVEKKHQYRATFRTFRHRSDLYIPFIEKSLRSLNPNGKLGFICSNRWLKNQYGSALRKYITNNFSIEKLIDAENINAFGEEVLAYPSIFVIGNKSEQTTTQVFTLEWKDDAITMNKNSYREITFKTDEWGAELFNHGKDQRQLVKLNEMGFEIGIGVATGAEDIFIGKHLVNEVENELLLPIISGRDLKGNQLDWKGTYLLNPFQHSGVLIDLERYPQAKYYLEKHSSNLLSRHVSKKNSNHWYKTIDRIKPELVGIPKILLPDISGNTKIFIDEGNYYPNHNIYFITGHNLDALKVIAALLMSEFVKHQLSQLSNLMNGGYPRWQSQNLRKIELPNIFNLSISNWEQLIEAYEKSDCPMINSIVTKILEDLPAKISPVESQLELNFR